MQSVLDQSSELGMQGQRVWFGVERAHCRKIVAFRRSGLLGVPGIHETEMFVTSHESKRIYKEINDTMETETDIKLMLIV